MRKKKCSLLFLWFACLSATGWAQDAGADQVLAEAFKVRQEFEEVRETWMEKYENAQTEEEKRELRLQRPNPAASVDKVLELIQPQSEDPAVLEHLAWVMEMSRGQMPEGAMETLEKHKDSAQLSSILPYLVLQGPGTKGWEFLTAVRQKSSHQKVQAMAAFVIANGWKVPNEEKAEELKFAQEHAGDLEFRGQKIAERAKSMLFAVENIAIGKVAPEIEGVDQDGVSFKLSDYRGKVVVLDFWGDW